MKVLDLGAHDGFVSVHVADELGEQITQLDGVELNSHGVEVFNRRIAERGLTGTCRQGRAEDAPILFTPASYDAVIAYELIEHVPDVEAFLDACEAMCAYGGQVYISTPDGVFGEGQNPHHLRVYRSIDLAEILRRRGDLQNMGVGPDGITVVSYVPWRAMGKNALPHGRGEVAIYTGPGWKEWSPLHRLQDGGLGGSETAAASIAEGLQRQGFNVTVYGQVEPGIVGQVAYRSHEAFDPMEPRQAIIYSRAPWMADRAHAAKKLILWCHDTDYGDQFTPEREAKFDEVLFLSTWHQEHHRKLYPWATKGRLFFNGIEPDYFEQADPPPGPRVPHRVLYTSSPDRGLDLLLEWWPEIRFHVPDAELLFCYADVYKAVADQRPEVAAHARRIAELAEQPGVTNLGALSQPNLVGVMAESGVWVHPSHNTPSGQPFYETFCIGAMEAAAAGCVRVMANHGALPERVMKDQPPTRFVEGVDQNDWIQAIVHGIEDAREHDGGGSGDALFYWRWAAAANVMADLID